MGIMDNWFEGRAATVFKPVDNGYVIRFRWPSRYYLVNEAEKAAILERMREVRRMIPAGVIVWSVGCWSGIMVGTMIALNPGGHLPVIGFLALLLVLVGPIIATMSIYSMHKLRPLAAGLRPTRPTTQEKISWSDSFKASAKVTSLSWLVGLGLGSIAIGLMQAFQLAENIQQGGPLDWMIVYAVGVAWFILSAIYIFALAFYKVART
jgi:hypothetical protein